MNARLENIKEQNEVTGTFRCLRIEPALYWAVEISLCVLTVLIFVLLRQGNMIMIDILAEWESLHEALVSRFDKIEDLLQNKSP